MEKIVETRLQALQAERAEAVKQAEDAAAKEKGEWTEAVLHARAEQLRAVKQVRARQGRAEVVLPLASAHVCSSMNAFCS